MLFAEPQKLLCGHLRQNQFQPGELDALLLMRRKKSQRMLIFPKWDWWKSELLEILKTRATGSWLEWTQWLAIPHRSCKWVQPSFFSPSSFLCNPVFVVFDEILFLQNAIFTLNVYNGQSQSVLGTFTFHEFLRMLKWWLLLYCREYQQCLTYHSSGQTKVLWQHPTIGWKVNNYILHHIYLLAMPISLKPAPRTETSMFETLQPFTPYSWLVEQRPGGESIFLQITEVFHCEDIDEKVLIVKILMKSLLLW